MSLSDGTSVGRIAGMHGRNGEQIALRAVRMRGSAAGLLFEMVVEQRYENAGADNIEVVYTFPLPPGGVLLGLELELAGGVMQARVALKAEAEERYEGALEQGNSALMVERAADGLYTVSLGNLMAGETAVVRYRYGQLLAFTQDQVRIAVPTVIAPRFGSSHKAGLAPHQAPHADTLARYSLDFSMVLTGQLCHGAVASPTHPLSVRVQDGTIRIALGADAVLDRDVVVSIQGLAGRSLAIGGHDGEGTVVLASFCPQAGAAFEPMPLALKILVDCSGSMNGDSIAGAKRALHEVLTQLDERDSFSYSCFGSTVSHCSAGLLPAEGRNVRLAANWVEATAASMGGTELGAALASAFELGGRASADILLITDGEIWQADEVVAAARRSGQRVFVVGIGGSPAAGFLRSIAERTGGACEFIAAGDDVGQAVLRCFNRLRQPRLAPPEPAWDRPAAWQSRDLSPLFYGETMHVFAGFDGPAPATARLTWLGAQGQGESAATVPMLEAGGDTLARMAAAARMAAMAKPERDALALRYQLVTENTNLIVVHERAAHAQATEPPVLHAVPQMLAAGWGGLGCAKAMPAGMAPAVWRRESASHQVRTMERNGVDAYDIPAFLRRAGDAPAPEPAKVYYNRDGLVDFLRAWASGSNLVSTGGSVWKTIAQLRGEVPASVFEALCDMRTGKYSEADVLTAFFGALSVLGAQIGLAGGLQAMLLRFDAAAARHPVLQERMRIRLDELLGETVAEVAPAPRPQGLLRSLLGRSNDIARFLQKQAD